MGLQRFLRLRLDSFAKQLHRTLGRPGSPLSTKTHRIDTIGTVLLLRFGAGSRR